MRYGGHRVVLAAGVLMAVLITGGPGGGPAEVGAAGESDFVGLTPCRLVDTRGNGFGGAFGPPALATGVLRDFPLQGQCGIPATALAVSLNVTATNTQGPGFLLLYPQGGVLPLVSTLNYVAGETVANAAIVPLGPGGLTVVAGVAGTDLVLDVNGYFTDSFVHTVRQTFFVGLGAPILGSTAVGYGVLANNTGSVNSAMGSNALASNLTGNSNTAIGASALLRNTAGSNNTAVGREALTTNDAGENNTAVGVLALENSVGSFNIALGRQAGRLTTGSGNIVIGSEGAADENVTIRLGTVAGHQRTFIAGIRDVTILNDAVPVLIDSTGQLGTTFLIVSSRRVKTDIEDIGERSRRLHALRPVTFHYRAQPDGPLQYGLIAEEVAEVYPELVTRDAEGAPAGVRYQVLPVLLLHELQAARAQLVELAATVAELAAEVARLKGRGSEAAGHHIEER